MSEYFIQKETLEKLADAIRKKALVNEQLSPEEMIEIIETKTYSDEDMRLWAYLSRSQVHMFKCSNPIYGNRTLQIDYGSPYAALQDFEYVINNDSSVTLIDWNETFNGIPSTELIIPDQRNIIL